MNRSLTLFLLLVFAFSLPGRLSFVPSVEAATTKSTGLVKKLKKQIATMQRQISSLQKQLAAAKAVPPTSTPFIETVTVGNAGNAADPEDGDVHTTGLQRFGAVPYEFQIGKYEVTLAQYTAFLNAVAATDTHDLYNPDMATVLNSAGIARNVTSDGFTYSVIGTGTRPVTYVSWFDAARFCNWLHNGRPTGLQTAGTTERGAYTLDGTISGGLAISRNPGAKFFIPSENEWYKAAYHHPSEHDGPVDHYWFYPTKSDLVPGNMLGLVPSPNQANRDNGVFSITQSAVYNASQNYLTEVGSYSASSSFYGTFDQGGNVWEWNDSVISGTFRGIRGGSWFDDFGDNLRSFFRNRIGPDNESSITGFRIASP